MPVMLTSIPNSPSHNAALGIGGEAVWHNTDSVGHTVTSGIESDSATWGTIFDSSLMAPDKMFSYKFIFDSFTFNFLINGSSN